jgi:enoyl-CoA hydratase
MVDDVLIEHDGDIAKVTLNMADDGNRVSDPLAVSLAATLRELATDARAIIFTGAGDDFCLGRSQMGRQGGGARPEALDLRDNNEIIFEAYGAFRDVDVPIVSVVRGRALGFGCALAAVCDMTLAADNARFALPEMGHNIMPTMAMSSLVDRLHRKAAVFMTYSTEEIDAHTALAYGLVSKVTALADLDGEVDKLIEALRKAPLPAVKAVKEFARNAFHNDIRTVNDFARNLHATVNASSRMQAG